jgi:hypothetical protein
MIIKLQTNDPLKQLIFSLTSFDAWGFTTELKVVSDWISCNQLFCFSYTNLENFLSSLKSLQNTFEGLAKLGGDYNDPTAISLEINNQGQILVQGTIEACTPELQRVAFSFFTDQTILGPLIEDFEKLPKHKS